VDASIYSVAHLKGVWLYVIFEAQIEEICKNGMRSRVQSSAQLYKVEILAVATLALLDFAAGANPKHSIFDRIEYKSDIDHGERLYFGALLSPRVLYRGWWQYNVR
jgi:hypothetical protein